MVELKLIKEGGKKKISCGTSYHKRANQVNVAVVWNFCGLLLHFRVNTHVPVSDLCTVKTFTFFQGKCIQILEWTYLFLIQY